MPLPNELTTVTPLSEALAMILFIILPFLGFLLGVQYQSTNVRTLQTQNINSLIVVATPTLLPVSPYPTPQIPVGWKTYINDTLKYQLAYPPNYTLEHSGSGDNYIAINSPLNPQRKLGDEGLENGELKIEIVDNLYSPPFYSTLNEYIKRKRLIVAKYPKLLESIKQTSVNGQDAMYEKDDNYSTGIESYTFIHNTKVINIVKYPLITTRQQEFNQILSTFQFLDSSQPSPNWKVYTNLTNGFTIQYPPRATLIETPPNNGGVEAKAKTIISIAIPDSNPTIKKGSLTISLWSPNDDPFYKQALIAGKRITIGNISFLHWTPQQHESPPQEMYFLDLNEKILYQLITENDNPLTNSDIFNKLIATFELIN